MNRVRVTSGQEPVDRLVAGIVAIATGAMSRVDDNRPHEADRRRRSSIFVVLVLLVLALLMLLSFCGGSDEPANGDSTTTLQSAASNSEPTTAVPPSNTVAESGATATTTPRPTLDGQWSMTVDVSVATGACAGEEDEEATPDTITVTQDGDTLTILGLGFPADSQVWEGHIEGTAVTFGGTRSEDDGTTTASFTLEVDFENQTMSGVEDWNWEGPGGSCPDSQSIVTAVRLGD